MINLRIKDENDNIIYEKSDDVAVDDKDYENILEALKSIDTNMVSFSLDSDVQDDYSHYAYSISRRCGKSEMSRQCLKLIREYNRQVAALPVHHPLEHGATGVRDSVDSVDSVDSDEPVDSVDSDESVDSVKPDDFENPDKSDRTVKPADRGFVSAPTLKEMLSSDDEIKALNRAIGNYLKRTGFYEKPYTWAREIERDFKDSIKHQTSTFKGYCDDYNQQKLVDETLGTYVGCDKHESCEKPNKRVKKDKEGNKERCTESCTLEDFIDYLNTYDSWATLIQELQLQDKKQIISKYQEWKVQK